MPHSTAKGSFYLAIASLVYLASNYIIYFSLARILSPEEFGIYSLALALVSAFAMVFASSIEPVASKLMAEAKSKAGIAGRIFSLELKISICLFAVFILFSASGLFAEFFKDSSLSLYFVLSSAMVLTMPLFSALYGMISGMREFRKQALLFASSALARLLLVVGFAFFGLSAFWTVAGLVLASFASLALAFFAFGKGLSGFRLFGIDAAEKRAFASQWPLIVFFALSALLTYVDIFAVKIFSPASLSNVNVAYYTAASSISRIPYFVLSTVSIVLVPLVARHGFAKIGKTREVLRAVNRYSFILLAPAIAFLFAFSEPVLVLFYTFKYSSAALSFSLLVLAMSFFGMFIVYSNVLTALGKQKIAAMIMAFAAFLTIALNILLVPAFSIEGAASATLISCLAAFLLSALYFLLKVKALTSWLSLARASVSAIAAAGILLFFPAFGWLLVLKFFAFILIYTALLWALGEIRKEDFKLALRIVK